LRQTLQRARHTHLLARRNRADAALPVQPLRRVHETVPLVALRAIELGDEREEAKRGRVQVAPELGDPRFELLEDVLLAGVGREVEGGFWGIEAAVHGCAPYWLFVQYS